MYKILIVDDELLVRTNIKLLLQKFSPDFSVCGEADNGKMGLKLISKLHPNLVFTDMRMPIMDGVEFCRKMHLAFPDIIIIALSNYDDYSYVRGALKNGATDYILKHRLNEATLTALLNEIRKSFPLLSGSANMSDNNLNALREKFISNLLAHMFNSEQDISANLQVLNIPLDTSQVLPVVFSVDNYAQITRDNSNKYLNTLNFSILNIGNEILEQRKNGIMTHLERGDYCILTSYPQFHSQPQVDEHVQSLLRQLSVNFKNYLNISCSFSIGNISNKITNIGEPFQKALSALQYIFYSGNQSILRSEDIEASNNVLSGLDYTLEKRLLSLTGNGNLTEVIALTDGIFQKLAEQKESISNIQIICTDMISILMRISKKNNIPLDRIFTNQLQPNQIFEQLNLTELHSWFTECFTNICEQIRLLLPGESKYVRSAIACINRDFSKPISQQSVADEIGISASYLSTIFKAETGQGFSDYLTCVRIRTAKQLLDNGEEDIHKLALACGFQDYAYFVKVFKKKVGVTPKAYIRK
ncbi:response regulator [Blautia producta]|uniref:response regulator transcription factor n=1 Tax=Blautia producta TaxID=33035 RepID=UPI001D00E909|nr:response regulator [Blautia producta]MCB5873847.1 response regulator [Blautia producta]